MLPKMIVQTLLAAVVIGGLAFGYQAWSHADGMAGAASGLARAVGGALLDHHDDE